MSDWNRLPKYVVDAPSINSLQNRIDNHWNDLDKRSDAISIHVQVSEIKLCISFTHHKLKRHILVQEHDHNITLPDTELRQIVPEQDHNITLRDTNL